MHACSSVNNLEHQRTGLPALRSLSVIFLANRVALAEKATSALTLLAKTTSAKSNCGHVCVPDAERIAESNQTHALDEGQAGVGTLRVCQEFRAMHNGGGGGVVISESGAFNSPCCHCSADGRGAPHPPAHSAAPHCRCWCADACGHAWPAKTLIHQHIQEHLIVAAGAQMPAECTGR
eukprot:1157339-Pelagomonas_calceolata.AAC.5